MSATDRDAVRIRVLVLLLAAGLFGLLVTTVYRHGGSPTDENLFINPPSPVYVAESSPAAGLDAGDILLAVDERRLLTFRTFAGVLDTLADDAKVRLRLRRPSGSEHISEGVPASALRAVVVRDIASTALVVEVTAGGASDRAGMRVGDVILRINEQAFRDVFEADAIMRRAQVGRATAYEVLRGAEATTLLVTLAAFGMRLSLVVSTLSGLLLMAFGAALAVMRPWIKAARYVGLGFLLIGYAFGVAFIRRDADLSTFTVVRDLATIGGVLFGLACLIHGEHYFPREMPTLTRHAWLQRSAYLCAATATAWIAAGGREVPFVAGLVALGLLAVAAKWLARRDRTVELRRMMRPLRWTSAAVVALVVAMLGIGQYLVPGDVPGFIGLALVAIPAAYLYTIGRYRLLDLDLRLRRTVQFSLLSGAWSLLVVSGFLWLVWRLTVTDMPLPNVRFTGASIEIIDTPVSYEQRAVLEKLVVALAAVLLTFAARHLGRRGSAWIAERFHRTAYDYRKAAREVTTVTSTRLDLEGLAAGIVSVVSGHMAVRRCGVLFTHGTRHHCVAEAHGMSVPAWREFCLATAPDIVQGASRAEDEVVAEYAFPRLRRALEAARIQYLYPIRAHERLVGVILVGEKLSELPFSADDFEFLDAVARQTAPAVENAFLYDDLAQQERLKHELELARRIQMESLPQFTPVVDGLDIAGQSVPAFEVGGDYFDYLDGHPPRFTVMVGDVSGKGTSAALYMSKLQGIVRSLHGFGLGPRELFVRTNDLIGHDLDRRAFVTALGAFFDLERHRLVLARAGHLPLLRLNAGTGEIDRFLPRGLGLGLTMGEAFDRELEELEIGYAPGDVFLFITDGITECQSPAREEFGEDRVIEFLSCLAVPHDARGVRDALMSAVDRFAGGTTVFDDRTVVVVRVQ